MTAAHIADWRAQARALGWEEIQLEGLASILAMAKHPQWVIAVRNHEIVVATRVVYRFTGTDRDGRPTAREVVDEGVWRWHHFVPQRDAHFVAEPLAPWCPAHQYACHPTARGCGLVGMMSYELCACRTSRHVPGCEVLRQRATWAAEQKFKAAAAPAAPPRAPRPPPMSRSERRLDVLARTRHLTLEPEKR